MSEPLGVVLAGGLSSRFGRPKACAELGGRPLLIWVAEAFATAGIDAIVVAKPESEIPQSELEVVLDRSQQQHPLAGLVTGLDAAGGRAIVVCACDMPAIAPGLLAYMAGLDVDSAVPFWNGRLQPLCARYGPATARLLERGLAEELPVRRIVGSLPPRLVTDDVLTRFGDPDAYLADIDNESSLLAFERNLERRGLL